MIVDATMLASMPLFAEVDPVDLTALLRAGRVRRFKAGEAVLTINTVAEHALLVLAGTLEVVLPAGDGRRVVGAIGTGEVVGETALLNPGRRRGASVVALTATVCLELRPAMVIAAVGNPALVAVEQHLLRSMAQRIRRSNQNIQRALDRGSDPRPLPERLREAIEVEQR